MARHRSIATTISYQTRGEDSANARVLSLTRNPMPIDEVRLATMGPKEKPGSGSPVSNADVEKDGDNNILMENVENKSPASSKNKMVESPSEEFFGDLIQPRATPPLHMKASI